MGYTTKITVDPSLGGGGVRLLRPLDPPLCSLLEVIALYLHASHLIIQSFCYIHTPTPCMESLKCLAINSSTIALIATHSVWDM